MHLRDSFLPHQEVTRIAENIIRVTRPKGYDKKILTLRALRSNVVK